MAILPLPLPLPLSSQPAALRMPLLDAVKGIACLLIVGHHLARYGPLSEGAAPLAPAFFAWLADDGRLAVQVFLVIGGFLAAGSLAPAGLLRGDRNAMHLLLHRYGRLVMPYLAALTCSVLVAAAARPWLDDDVVPSVPSLPQLVAHGLLLQDLLGYESLSAGVWYVAIDFQLFALALVVFAAAGAVQRRWRLSPIGARWLGVASVLGLVGFSLAVFNRHPVLDSTAIYFFGAYGLGMLAFWIGRATRAKDWRTAFLLLCLIGVAALWLDWRSRIAVALLTALAIVLAERRHWLCAIEWPALGQPLLRIGRISYALFLIHFPVILAVNAVATRWPVSTSAWGNAAGLAAAFMLSLAAAALLYRLVESRPASWRFVAGMFAGLIVCGLFVSLQG